MISDEVLRKWRRRRNVGISSRRRRTRWGSNGKDINTRSFTLFSAAILERED